MRRIADARVKHAKLCEQVDAVEALARYNDEQALFEYIRDHFTRPMYRPKNERDLKECLEANIAAQHEIYEEIVRVQREAFDNRSEIDILKEYFQNKEMA